MRLKPGAIYFVRESDRETGQYTQLVKIGLAEFPSTPIKRLKSHQTGNPNDLSLVSEGLDDGLFGIQTEAVGYVEAQLHRVFGSKRVRGEWFKFETDEEIQQAVAKAKDLSVVVGQSTLLFEKAEELATFLNDGNVLTPNTELKSLFAEATRLNLQISAFDALSKRIDKAFKDTFEVSGADSLEGFYSIIHIPRDPAFSVEKFKKIFKDEPELIESCYVVTEVFSEKFAWEKYVGETDLPPRTQELLSNLSAAVDESIEKSDLASLNNLQLQITQEKAPLSWEASLLEARVKVACGLAPGIEGVCTWIRALKPSRNFSEAQLFAKDPEKYYLGFEDKAPIERKTFLGRKSKPN